MSNSSKQKIWVALSGGVDSAVSALILKNKGYDVIGVFMKNWSGDGYGIQIDCPWEQDQRDAKKICQILNIPFRSVNFEKEYRNKVIEYFFSELNSGRTPNPDIMCNREIKFGLFLEKAQKEGADLIATGHYARTIFNKRTQNQDLFVGIDSNKDQSYFLSRCSQKQINSALFPIGIYTKAEVREIAEKNNLPVHNKPDSQGICFIGEINVNEFIRKTIMPHHGEIIDIESNKKVGTHDGIEFYTIGQREGLKIGGLKMPYYVVSKNKKTNILYVAQGEKNKYLNKINVTFSSPLILSQPKSNMLSAVIRYRQKPESGEINLEEKTFTFHSPQRAVTPGQIIAFYEGEQLIGSAIIEN